VREALRAQRQFHLIHPGQPALPLANDLRLERVGFRDATLGMRLRIDKHGRQLPEDGGHRAPSNALTETCEHTTVWLERDGSPGPLDQLILERCSRSVHTVLQQAHTVHPVVTAIRVACAPDSRDADRADALRHLGLREEIVVVATPGGATSGLPGPIIDGQRIALLTPGRVADLVGKGIPAGLARSFAEDLPSARGRASLALRLAVDPADGGPAQIWHEDLGSLAELAERFDGPSAAAVPDVRLLERLRGEKPWVTGLLDALLSHRSMRDVARRQNLHHSTLRERLTWLEQRLGYTVLSRDGYARASMTLVLWRIAASSLPEVPG
jgi:hypothetical protein